MMRMTLIATLLALIPMTGCESCPMCEDKDHVHDHHHGNHHYESVYRHVVAFRYKEGTTQAQIDEINAAFAALENEIDTILHFEYGPNVSPEGLNDGFGYCYVVTFADKAGLDVYLPHPAHKAFVEKLKPVLDKPFVIDYETKTH